MRRPAGVSLGPTRPERSRRHCDADTPAQCHRRARRPEFARVFRRTSSGQDPARKISGPILERFVSEPAGAVPAPRRQADGKSRKILATLDQTGHPARSLTRKDHDRSKEDRRLQWRWLTRLHPGERVPFIAQPRVRGQRRSLRPASSERHDGNGLLRDPRHRRRRPAADSRRQLPADRIRPAGVSAAAAARGARGQATVRSARGYLSQSSQSWDGWFCDSSFPLAPSSSRVVTFASI